MSVYISNTNILEVRGLQESISGDYVNSLSTVTVAIVDECGQPVSGASWPITMIYTPGTDGDYRAVIPSSTSFSSGEAYFAEISVNAGVNKIGFWRHKFRPVNRQ